MTRTYDGVTDLARRADRLAPANPAPGLFVLTDPERTPDIIALARRLSADCGLVLRTFGRPEMEALAYSLTEIARERGFEMLISADPELARRCGANGVHWPEWSLARADRPWPGARVTASVHRPAALRRAQAFADALFVSSVCPSRSPSAGRPMGGLRLAAWARRSAVPVYALGGVNARTIMRLSGLGVGGAAVVGAAVSGYEKPAPEHPARAG